MVESGRLVSAACGMDGHLKGHEESILTETCWAEMRCSQHVHVRDAFLLHSRPPFQKRTLLFLAAVIFSLPHSNMLLQTSSIILLVPFLQDDDFPLFWRTKAFAMVD